MATAELIGHLCLIWMAVDELGEDFEGDDEDIASALSAPVCAQTAQTAQTSALLCAMVEVGWAARFDGGISFNSNDPSAQSRADAHRARAARSYERKKTRSAQFCAEPSADSAVCASSPSSPTYPMNDSVKSEDASLQEGEKRLTEDQIAAIAKSPRKAPWLKAVNRHCSPTSVNRLYLMILAWHDGDEVWQKYEAARAGASKAKNAGAYWAACVRNANKEMRGKR